MAHTIAKLDEVVADKVKIQTALVSVFDKTGLEELGAFLAEQKVHILSTGGTASKLRSLGCTVEDVAEYTGSPEILDGRVKTLHPKVHGGLLAARGSEKHVNEMKEHGIRPIDLVVVNLYPFTEAVAKGGDFATCIENIDIGGPAMVRASAKNHAGVSIVTSPSQYEGLLEQIKANDGCTTLEFRKNLACAAYSLTASYDATVSSWFAGQVTAPPALKTVALKVERPLKYGCNPHQLPAGLCSVGGGKLPFDVVSGTPGYINLLDAVNAWQLVHELSKATGKPAAASFKHVSPAGAAIGVPLNDEEREVYEVVGKELSETAAAYVRARNADPMCSFGDFVAVSGTVDVATANILKIEVSDGIIAGDFEPEALEILKAKKQGKFIVLRADESFKLPEFEYRTAGGVGFMQKRNDALFDASKLTKVVADKVKIQTALVSVFDKTGLEELGAFLAEQKVHILSTGGTASKLRSLGCTVEDVAEYTGSPEILDGRVKTLHPKVHGGLLAARGSEKHVKEMKEHGIRPIDLVVVNLYPFTEAVAKGGDFATCIENIDIGGPAMVRASAKNHAGVSIVTSPAQYEGLLEQIKANDGCTTLEFRKNLACAAYSLTASYDATVSSWFAGQVTAPPALKTVALKVERPLKYGCNPHQLPAGLCSVGGGKLPFDVVSGTPGYINLLDAVNAWQLVHELSQATGKPAAASFKHVSPAGAAIGVPLNDEEREVYEVVGKELTETAAAYVRARNADPMCSFGDFVAVSGTVDVATANILKIEVSDGIIAGDFEPEALEILKAKKQGKFIVLKADESFKLPEFEYRTAGGVGFMQKRNDALFDASKLTKVVTKSTAIPDDAKLDLILASVAIKFTQSNSVGYAKGGMMLGVGAGQQSRVDCVKLAGRKVATWRLRFHPKVKGLKFKEGVKRQDRVNARVRFIEGDMDEVELNQWKANFDQVPESLTAEEKAAFLKELSNVTISSDAFFPFRDSIDHATKLGVKYVAQPGGSVADAEVIEACDTYGMTMAFTDLRLFHH